jgi:hypothetical protein
MIHARQNGEVGLSTERRQDIPLHSFLRGQGQWEATQEARSMPPFLPATTLRGIIGSSLEFPTSLKESGALGPSRIPRGERFVEDLSRVGPPRQSLTTRSEQTHGRLTGPVQVVARLAEIWRLDHGQLATLLDYESARDVEDLLCGVLTLRGRDRHDRVRNLFRIHEVLDQLFIDEDTEQAWLREAQDQLGGRSVLDLLLSGSMEQMILARRYVEHLAGR